MNQQQQDHYTGMHQSKRNFCRYGIRGSSAFLNSSNIIVYRYCHLLYSFGNTSPSIGQVHLLVDDCTLGLFQRFSVVIGQ